MWTGASTEDYLGLRQMFGDFRREPIEISGVLDWVDWDQSLLD